MFQFSNLFQLMKLGIKMSKKNFEDQSATTCIYSSYSEANVPKTN